MSNPFPNYPNNLRQANNNSVLNNLNNVLKGRQANLEAYELKSNAGIWEPPAIAAAKRANYVAQRKLSKQLRKQQARNKTKRKNRKSRKSRKSRR